MKKRFVILAVMILALSLALSTGYGAEKKKMMKHAKTIIINPDDIEWKDGPAALPNTKMAVLEGDPKQRGFFVMRLELPAGGKIPTHVHDNVERVTIISGKLMLAMGSTSENPKGLPAGSFFSLPPKTEHNAWADEETVLQISTQGPWTFKPMQ